ncbi:MAG: CoA pyrophosphatase [Ignavibacteriales bacterium]|nr:CoA pyrophosphatase [Ignavibacteriales bacterium]
MNISKEHIQSSLQQRQRKTITDSVYRRSAVLLPILIVDGIPSLLFTKRTETVETHKGQISFPGGTEDDGDGSPAGTALREAQEEIGLPSEMVDVLGMLDDIQTPTGFIITPVVGWIEESVTLQLNHGEVAECFSVPLEHFTDTVRRSSRLLERNGVSIEVYFYDVWKEPVWGATAFCVKQLMDSITSGHHDSIR